jgi:hypothetical protein
MKDRTPLTYGRQPRTYICQDETDGGYSEGVTDTPTPTPEDLIAGIADMLGSLRAEIDRESQESPGMAMPLARQLLAVLREETAESSALYSRVVYRLREERKLSLAQLATQLDVSKQYVADMVNRGKALEEGSGT